MTNQRPEPRAGANQSWRKSLPRPADCFLIKLEITDMARIVKTLSWCQQREDSGVISNIHGHWSKTPFLASHLDPDTRDTRERERDVIWIMTYTGEIDYVL